MYKSHNLRHDRESQGSSGTYADLSDLIIKPGIIPLVRYNLNIKIELCSEGISIGKAIAVHKVAG